MEIPSWLTMHAPPINRPGNRNSKNSTAVPPSAASSRLLHNRSATLLESSDSEVDGFPASEAILFIYFDSIKGDKLVTRRLSYTTLPSRPGVNRPPVVADTGFPEPPRPGDGFFAARGTSASL